VGRTFPSEVAGEVDDSALEINCRGFNVGEGEDEEVESPAFGIEVGIETGQNDHTFLPCCLRISIKCASGIYEDVRS
jgi:hypothetical protein